MRSIAQTVISFVLVFSILGPSVLSYVDHDFGSVIVAELSDDKKSEKEKSDKDKEEKEYILYSLMEDSTSTSGDNPDNFNQHVANVNTLVSDIVLPPPESRA